MTYFAFGLPDEPGELARFAQQLRDAGISLVALWGDTTGDGPESRLACVPESAAAFRVFMQTAEFTMEEGQTFYCTAEDRPGALIEALSRIAVAGINIDTIESVAVGKEFGCFVWAAEDAWPKLAEILSVS